jgi:ABC-type polar amino acid transport system ATPase subunit
MDELFRLEDVTVVFGRHEVLKKFNLSIYDRERIAICGPSGTGKSTLLRCLNLLQHIEHGTIYFRGQKIIEATNGVAKVLVDENAHRSRVGIVFQEFNLWPNKSILKNITEGPIYVKKLPVKRSTEKARELCALVNVEPCTRTDDDRLVDNIRRSSRAASVSALRWRARWLWSPKCCYSTRSRPPRPAACRRDPSVSAEDQRNSTSR